MDGDSALKLTTAIYLTPNGTNINKKGITPDIVVSDKPKTKQDEQLQRALAYLAGLN
jgi:carboxyl-terminal processing protease